MSIGDTMVEITYECKCGAKDHGRFFPEEHPFPVITCFSCGGGRGKDIAGMMQEGVGMYPLLPKKSGAQVQGR